VPASEVPLMSISKEQLKTMASSDIVNFAWQYLGVSLDPGLSKEKLVVKLLSLAMHVA
jgi:hypothetical protein